MKNLLKNMFRWLYGEEPMPTIDSVDDWDTSSVVSFDEVIANAGFDAKNPPPTNTD